MSMAQLPMNFEASATASVDWANVDERREQDGGGDDRADNPRLQFHLVSSFLAGDFAQVGPGRSRGTIQPSDDLALE